MERHTNIFSKIKIKDYFNSEPIHNQENVKLMTLMLNDWDFLSKKFPQQGKEIFNQDHKTLGILLKEYKSNYLKIRDSTKYNKTINNILTSNIPIKSYLESNSNSNTNYHFEKYLREFPHQIHFPCILQKNNEDLNSEMSCDPKLHNSNRKSGIADGANLNININKLNSSQKKENIDEIFNKIISSEVVKQLNKNNHLNTNASTKKIGTKKSNYVTIFKRKFKIPENIGNNKINPSFYNLFKNDNYIKYAKKIKNIKSIDPCLKQIYYLKPPSDDKLKAIEMLEKEISVKKKKCSDLPNLDLDKNPSNQSKSRNEKNENKSVSILENMTYRSRNTITNMKTIKFNHLNSKEKNKANDKIYTIDTNEYIANTVNSIVSDKLKEGNRSSRNITTIDTLRTEDGRISQRRFNSQCDKQIEYAQKNFISTLESRNLYNEKFDKTFKTTFGNKDLYQEKLLANDVITEYRNAGTFAFSEKNLGFFLKHKNKIFQNLFVKNEN